MTMMTAGTGGFSGSAPATGPNAGYDPVIKFRGKLKDKKKLVAPGNKMKAESKENPTFPSRLLQYRVNIPEVGETIVYASSPAELRQKMRLLINPRFRGDIEIERIFPGDAGKFFMNKRMKHMRNVAEELEENNPEASADAAKDNQQMANKQVQQKIAMEKKKVQMKKQELQKQLQMKVQQLKKQARAGAVQDATK